MTYREKLIQLQNTALEKLKNLQTLEETLINEESICDVVCDPAHEYNKVLVKYNELEEALNQRNALAKRVTEEKIDINQHMPD